MAAGNGNLYDGVCMELHPVKHKMKPKSLPQSTYFIDYKESNK